MDRYEKIKLLGEGAFGSAYLVRPKDERRVFQVAKEIRISHLTEKQREGAVAESEVLRMLKHPNIIAYINSFSEGSRMYIVMEYADGGDLAAKIKERKDSNTHFEEWEVMRIFVQLVLALIYIHSRKIVHRDLKPLNVFLTLQGVVKLGDFGIARVLESSTCGAQTTIGTPHYLSPEVVNNEAYGTRSDLWSLGVVTYELCALRVPFGGNSLPAVAMKIMGADPEPLALRSPELNWIVMSLLSKEPSQRPRLEAVQRLPFVQKYIEELLSYSRETGAGGCEAMTERRSRRTEPDGRAEPSVPRRAARVGGAPQALERKIEAAQAEFVRTRQAALEAKRRVEGETKPLVEGPAPQREQRRPRKTVEEQTQLSGKEREAEVRRRARQERDELDALHWDALSKARREHQEERRKLELRLRGHDEVPPPVDSFDDSPSCGVPRKDKLAEEAEYLEKLAEARREQAQERRRLAEKLAKMADDEVPVVSEEEVDSDKENAVCFVLKRPREMDGGGDPGPMLLEIPFTDKVKPKPKLTSDTRFSKRSVIESRDTDRAPPLGRAREPSLSAAPPEKPLRPAVAIRAELGLRSSSRGAAAPGRASGTPAQWLRSGSCDRPSRSRDTAATLERLPPSGRRRPSLENAYSSPSPAPAPPTPQGAGDVSQLQDALSHALCGVEGVQVEPIPEEIAATLEAFEVPTMNTEDALGEMSLVSDWKDTYE